jgi:chemotaxis response regulator CheB/chemotaxis methyl-accepting protein methylase
MAHLLSEHDKELLFDIAEKTIGTCQRGRFRHEVIVSNVERCIFNCGASSLQDYLQKIKYDTTEYDKFISAITIHTTSWFREMPHYERLQREIEAHLSERRSAPFRICSAACSTGQEVYSFALILEQFRSINPFFEYELIGIDIDPVSIRTAQIGVYPIAEAQSIPQQFRHAIMVGSGKTEGFFTLTKAIRDRCRFFTSSILTIPKFDILFDRVVCRNVLIYFSPDEVKKIIPQLIAMLNPQGELLLGHSEAIDPREYKLVPLGNASYQRKTHFRTNPSGRSSEKILIVEDCLITQKVLAKHLEDFTCEFAKTTAEATEILKRKEIDLITLDLHMPDMNGLSWLQLQRRSGLRTPIIVLTGAKDITSDEVLGALEHGAQDFIDKASIEKQSLAIRIKGFIAAFNGVKKTLLPNRGSGSTDVTLFKPDVILIGASTGGPETLAKLLKHMPAESPPIIVVQHLSPDFAPAFANRIAENCGLTWDEPLSGKNLKRGHVYIASGDYHIGIRQGTNGLTIYTSDAPPENRHRPSVDFLFNSAAKVKARIFAILLTGMGDDGARGLLALKQQGALTFCQDEQSSIVFGMPKEAIALGAATVVGNVGDIRVQIDRALSLRR